jgi:hypothetical protein
MALTDDELNQMEQIMKDEGYSTASIRIFLNELKKYLPVSLCSAVVFDTLEMAIMSLL